MTRFKAFLSCKQIARRRIRGKAGADNKDVRKPICRPLIAAFRDDRYLRPGLDLPGVIRANPDQAEFLVYLASPEARASERLRSEFDRWCADQKRRTRLIIVLTDGSIGVDVRTRRWGAGSSTRTGGRNR